MKLAAFQKPGTVKNEDYISQNIWLHIQII